jgi:hypothetical protein
MVRSRVGHKQTLWTQKYVPFLKERLFLMTATELLHESTAKGMHLVAQREPIAAAALTDALRQGSRQYKAEVLFLLTQAPLPERTPVGDVRTINPITGQPCITRIHRWPRCNGTHWERCAAGVWPCLACAAGAPIVEENNG